MATLAGCGPSSVSVPAVPVTSPPPAVASVPPAPAVRPAPADDSAENEGSGGENEPDENEGGNTEP